MRRRLEDLIRDAVWNRDLDEVLVGGHHQIGMHQLFQQRGGIVLRGVDDRTRMRVPATRIEAGALGSIDRERTVRVPDAIAFQDPVGLLNVHTPPLYAARPIRLTTASAPGPVARATSSGALSSSIGCGRSRKARTLASSRKTSIPKANTLATRARRSLSSVVKSCLCLRRRSSVGLGTTR